MSACKRCGGAIGWKREGGNWKPTDPDGMPHVCTRAPARQPETLAGPRITGARYLPSCGECGSPPWEHCACSRLLANQGART